MLGRLGAWLLLVLVVVWLWLSVLIVPTSAAWCMLSVAGVVGDALAIFVVAAAATVLDVVVLVVSERSGWLCLVASVLRRRVASPP